MARQIELAELEPINDAPPGRIAVLRPSVAKRPGLDPRILNRTVIIASLGYFVDIYDLLLFSTVRPTSLAALGVPQDQIFTQGVFLFNVQMGALLLGGLIWGVLGDKRGRISVLFGSIALYSAANIANAFVTDVNQYAVLRFAAGIGLAGELGAAITLVSEVMSKEKRGWGTVVVVSVGILGAVLAYAVGSLFDWRAAFLVGGVLGLGLLVMRYKMSESGMFRATQGGSVRRGDLRMLVGNKARAVKYAACILIGLPIWYTIGILITFAPEITRELGATAPVSAGAMVAVSYAGASAGDLITGAISQKLRTRWWVICGSLGTTAGVVFAYLFARGWGVEGYYALAFLIGLGAGYWGLFIMVAAEQFGTNLRATVTTTVPNFIRGSVIPLTLGFQFLALNLGLGFGRSALIVGIACLLIALLALRFLGETYGKDLDYVEAEA